MKRTPIRRKTRLRSVGAKATRLRAGWETSTRRVLARSLGRCENPWCAHSGRDYHHIVKRSQGRDDSPLNLVHLCRPCHDRTDLPRENPARLGIETFMDGMDRTFALFSQYSDISKPVALNPPAEDS